jgi:hypothetical protein
LRSLDCSVAAIMRSQIAPYDFRSKPCYLLSISSGSPDVSKA